MHSLLYSLGYFSTFAHFALNCQQHAKYALTSLSDGHQAFLTQVALTCYQSLLPLSLPPPLHRLRLLLSHHFLRFMCRLDYVAKRFALLLYKFINTATSSPSLELLVTANEVISYDWDSQYRSEPRILSASPAL